MMKRSTNGELVIVTFNLDPDDWHGRPREGLWAEPLRTGKWGTVYQLRNSPFFARGISHLDVVRAEPRVGDPPELAFVGVVDRAGHSTYMILVPPDSPDFTTYLGRLEKLGCSYESKSLSVGPGLRTLYSIDVPPSSDINAVYAILEQGEQDKVWIFQEGHVGHTLNSTN